MSLESQSGTPYRSIPVKRQQDFERERRALNQQFPNAEDQIRVALNGHVNDWLIKHRGKPTAAFSSSWIPGADWNEGSGVFQPIYETMLSLYGDAALAHRRAGWFFGLILMDVMIRRTTDHWTCWHEPTNRDEDPLGMFYKPVTTGVAQ